MVAVSKNIRYCIEKEGRLKKKEVRDTRGWPGPGVDSYRGRRDGIVVPNSSLRRVPAAVSWGGGGKYDQRAKKRGGRGLS